MRDLVIVGSGPAGLAAAIYGKRFMFDEVVVEREAYSGGQIVVTDRVDNYPGELGISGSDLACKFRQHADKLGVAFIQDTVTAIENGEEYKITYLESGEIIKSKNIIIATGASHRLLNVKGEQELKGSGVSYCALCDGALFKSKTVAVIGGGDVALKDALYLANICKKVYVVHRRDTFKAAEELQEKIKAKDNIIIIFNCVVDEIIGKNTVEKIIINDIKREKKSEIDVEGVFIAVGMEPQSKSFSDVVEVDDNQYIVAGEDCRTNVDGICVAGDIRTKEVRQIVTAVADGAIAIESLRNKK